MRAGWSPADGIRLGRAPLLRPRYRGPAGALNGPSRGGAEPICRRDTRLRHAPPSGRALTRAALGGDSVVVRSMGACCVGIGRSGGRPGARRRAACGGPGLVGRPVSGHLMDGHLTGPSRRSRSPQGRSSRGRPPHGALSSWPVSRSVASQDALLVADPSRSATARDALVAVGLVPIGHLAVGTPPRSAYSWSVSSSGSGLSFVPSCTPSAIRIASR
jgi:hypothetical protein